MPRSLVLPLLIFLGWFGPAQPTRADDHEFEVQTLQFQSDRAAKLRAEDGWLSVAGLFWPKPGDSRIGSAPDSEIPLRAGTPATVGTLTLASDGPGDKPGAATFQPAPGVDVRLNGQPFQGGSIQSDAAGATADVLAVGDLRFILLRRNNRYALRLKDNASPTRLDFAGLRWYPPAEDWVVVGTFHPYAIPRTIAFETIIGGQDVLPSPGTVTFEVNGQTHTLQAATETSDGKLWFVFRDATAGQTTPANGRQLTADPPRGGIVILDFNQAINLPCAYIDHATCPIAPPQNRLPIAIHAGERLPKPRPSEAKAH